MAEGYYYYWKHCIDNIPFGIDKGIVILIFLDD